MLLEPEIEAVGFSPEQWFRSDSLRRRDRDSGEGRRTIADTEPVR